MIISDHFWESKTLSSELSNIIYHIDDIETFTKLITKYDKDKLNLDVIVFGTGGTVRASDYIITTLMRYSGVVRMHVPFYAHSAMTMIVLSGQKIYMNPLAHLSPTDPQVYYKIGSTITTSSYSVIELSKIGKPSDMSDKAYVALQEAISLHADNLNNLRLMLEPKGVVNANLNTLLDMFGSGRYPHHKLYHPDVLNKYI